MAVSESRTRIAVIGGGVVGLTTAITLASRYDVTLIAEKIGVDTDSRKATAIWHVYLVPETAQVLDWAKTTLGIYCRLASTDPSSGLELVEGVELFRNSHPSLPSWADIPPLFKMLTQDEIAVFNRIDPAGVLPEETIALQKNPVIWGYHIAAPAANMYTYLPWLQTMAESKSVTMIKAKVGNLNDLVEDYDLVINCTGFGARELVNDQDFEIYKGQYFILKSNTFAPVTYIGDDDHPGGMAYMIPRAGEVTIGGCAEKGIENLELTLEWEDTIRRAGLYVPWIRSVTKEQQSRAPVVCLRPSRKGGIRLELDTSSSRLPVIHNYGHGGSGFSLAWGCADSVERLVASLLS